jgi:hypothetical protein
MTISSVFDFPHERLRLKKTLAHFFGGGEVFSVERKEGQQLV